MEKSINVLEIRPNHTIGMIQLNESEIEDEMEGYREFKGGHRQFGLGGDDRNGNSKMAALDYWNEERCYRILIKGRSRKYLNPVDRYVLYMPTGFLRTVKSTLPWGKVFVGDEKAMLRY